VETRLVNAPVVAAHRANVVAAQLNQRRSLMLALAPIVNVKLVNAPKKGQMHASAPLVPVTLVNARDAEVKIARNEKQKYQDVI